MSVGEARSFHRARADGPWLALDQVFERGHVAMFETDDSRGKMEL
jgi:hypothetical protein